ncbi:glycoside hydrolase family 17 protein [Lineolata rhizophorae]|uniref:glucan endo-1,3-beta-D-glucosidase n=1 Tax=Lineolata rhizophorae TaxID=578093 RepID=A0A6A6NQE2_9PEZI|nr:glycoside hydrolase family 17 protein [Lineolata rhizophorae]
MNNDDLHRVFPGIDYTPLNAQYPDCINTKPSQNNVTRDVAVLSQLTKEIRLYGTDCNQTEMVLHAIDRLELTDVKVWLGVWLGPNDTTNDRQLHQMYSLLDDHGADPFAGVIIGNEVLFREDLTSTELAEVLADVKSNLTERDLDLPLATSDLGDNWTQQLASEVDIVMANIHPFFAGVTADEAAAWTWNFWTTKDVVLTEGTNKKNYISEVGWPSAGGKSCGSASSCTEGSVAGIDEMNTFMEHWVCQSLTNGTAYFWFEAFDEPWKIQFNEDGKEWEDKWGLMDVNRNLKDGVKIPDCDGRTA